jgi:hypothetical protein
MKMRLETFHGPCNRTDMHDTDADFTEFKPDERLEAIRQEHEPFLTQLEALAVQAIATNDWDGFYAHVVDFQNEHDLHGEAEIVIGENPIMCPTVGHATRKVDFLINFRLKPAPKV